MKKLFKALAILIIAIIIVILGFTVANRLLVPFMIDNIFAYEKVEYENQLHPQYDEYGVPYFVTDGDFKVMQLTDIHLGGSLLSYTDDIKALDAVAAMITAEKPDLVVITGDTSFAVPWAANLNNSTPHQYLLLLMEELGVYWTITFGNHDSENYNFYDREAVGEMYEDDSYQYCLFESDDGGVYGVGNHLINVRNTQGLISQTIFMMDTNSYTDDDPLGLGWIYDNIHEDQIEWYRTQVERYSAYNKTVLAAMPESERPKNVEDFTTVQSLLFVHIPLIEMRTAYHEYLAAGEKDTDDVKYIFGDVGESEPYVYPSEIEEEMFETMLELGSTRAMFFGHDHLNNIVLEYKGFTFCYGYSVDFFAYIDIDKVGSQRGCTMITCSPDASFEIVHENYYQDKYQPLNGKTPVDMGN